MDPTRPVSDVDSKSRILEEGPLAEEQQSQGFPVVGIGASAGGLQAFRKLLDHLPPDTKMAYVLIPHLYPTHESLITELLSRSSRTPIQQVEPDLPYAILPIR